MRKGKVLTAALTMAIAVGLVVPAQASHVEPEKVKGNPRCETVESPGTQLKYDPVKRGKTKTFDENDGLPEGAELVVAVSRNGKFADFTASGVAVADVIVKGGWQANHYTYDPPTHSDEELHAPPLFRDKLPQIGHIVFCWVEDVITLECETDPATVNQEPFYELILRDCEGAKQFDGRFGVDEAGNQFVELRPVGEQGTAQFLETIVFEPEEGIGQTTKTLFYDDFVGAGEREMPFCNQDPRATVDGTPIFELAEDTDPNAVLPAEHTSCIVLSEFVVVDGGVQASYIVYSFADGFRSFR